MAQERHGQDRKRRLLTQPKTFTVTAGNEVVLTVLASGTAPFTYQWRKAGQPIAGAAFHLASAAVSDTGYSGVHLGTKIVLYGGQGWTNMM